MMARRQPCVKKLTALLALASLCFPLVALGAIKAEPKSGTNDPTTPAQDSELRPPRAELPPPLLAGNHYALIFGCIGAGVMIVSLTVLCWPKKQPPVPPGAFAIARQCLDALHAIGDGATPLAVSAVVRRFATDAFALNPTGGNGLTSEEVVSGLVTQRACPVELTNEVWRFLSECDVAKFAPGADVPQSVALFENAVKLIGEMEAARARAERTL
jgi:hypothetical protein